MMYSKIQQLYKISSEGEAKVLELIIDRRPQITINSDVQSEGITMQEKNFKIFSEFDSEILEHVTKNPPIHEISNLMNYKNVTFNYGLTDDNEPKSKLLFNIDLSNESLSVPPNSAISINLGFAICLANKFIAILCITNADHDEYEQITACDSNDNGLLHVNLFTTSGKLKNYQCEMGIYLVNKNVDVHLDGVSIISKKKQTKVLENIWNLNKVPCQTFNGEYLLKKDSIEFSYMKKKLLIKNSPFLIISRKRSCEKGLLLTIGGLVKSKAKQPVAIGRDLQSNDCICLISPTRKIKSIFKMVNTFTNPLNTAVLNGNYSSSLPNYKEIISNYRNLAKINTTQQNLIRYVDGVSSKEKFNDEQKKILSNIMMIVGQQYATNSKTYSDIVELVKNHVEDETKIRTILNCIGKKSIQQKIDEYGKYFPNLIKSLDAKIEMDTEIVNIDKKRKLSIDNRTTEDGESDPKKSKLMNMENDASTTEEIDENKKLKQSNIPDYFKIRKFV